MKHILIFLLLCLLPFQARAADLEYKDFARLPVQHEGRIKPLDTFARNYLNLFSGRQSLEGMSPEAWLAETLFDPAQALHRPIFRIFRPEFLDLPTRASRYYSYAEIAPALQAKMKSIQKLSVTDEKDWSEDQRELMRLQEASFHYTQLLRSFSYILPLNINIPPTLAKTWKISEEKPFTLQEFRRFSGSLQERVKKIVRVKGEDPSKYSKEEQAIALFAMDMQILEQAGQDNVLFRIVPGQWNAANGEWFSPWALTESGQGSPQTASYLKLWQDMAVAYLQQDTESWKVATETAAKDAAAFSPSHKISIELLYNNAHPLVLCMGLYLIGFLGFIVYSLNGRYRVISLAALTVGAVVHAATIAARIIILSRPPVGTLYESILFVALICVIVALVLEWLKKDGNGIAIGALSGLLLLFIAQAFAGDDTMKMLVAVLNTNFWLATHVLCITMGYGWCLIVSLLAHIWLIKTAMGKRADDLLTPIKILTLIALLFTAIGTILGGIWADQSWGRFWGWDPKENGALLIVLWLIWILHAQISGHLKRKIAIAALASTSIIVGIAWFGVNLLNVGLHSYGFITGVAASLGAFCAAEILLIGFLLHKSRSIA